jgi:hypothetical protein
VLSDEPQMIQPGEKMIQARVTVSLLAYGGAAEYIDECLYRFESASNMMQVVDYLPRTTMDTSLAGNIRVQRSKENSSQINLGVDGGFELIHANAGGSLGQAARSALEYELAPPQEMVAAVGTIGRGTGVYFKLRRTPQVSLEGSRDFMISLRVPMSWRGGYFRAYCQAVQRTHRGVEVVGAGTFLLPLYLAGDFEAKQLAENLSNSEQRLYAVARKNQREVERRSHPTIAHELALVDPKIPHTWFQQVLEYHPSSGSGLSFEARLPSDLQASIDQYRTAGRRLMQLRATVTAKPVASLANTDPSVAATAESGDDQAIAQADAWRARSE